MATCATGYLVPTAESLIDAVVTALGAELSGWKRASHPPAAWYAEGVTLDAQTWAVEIGDTEIMDPRSRTTTTGGVSDASVGCRSRTTLIVRWVSRIRPDSPHTSYRAAIVERTTILQAVAATNVSGLGPISPRRVAFDVTPGQLPQLCVQRAEFTWDHFQPIQ